MQSEMHSELPKKTKHHRHHYMVEYPREKLSAQPFAQIMITRRTRKNECVPLPAKIRCPSASRRAREISRATPDGYLGHTRVRSRRALTKGNVQTLGSHDQRNI